MPRASHLTLCDMIQAVRDVASNEQEVIAAIPHLLSSGQVRLRREAVAAWHALMATAAEAA